MRGSTILLLLLHLPICSWAGLIPVLDITDGGFATTVLGHAVVGWQFEVTQSVAISALGVWDEDGNGLDFSHQVGLWTLDETLIRAATVDNTSTPAGSTFPGGRWLFTAITPVVLDPGSYVLGAVWESPDYRFDFFHVDSTFATSFGVSFVQERFKGNLLSPDLVFPDQGLGAGGGIFGPNAAVWMIPEPATAVPAAAGILLIWAICMGRWAGITVYRRAATGGSHGRQGTQRRSKARLRSSHS